MDIKEVRVDEYAPASEGAEVTVRVTHMPTGEQVILSGKQRSATKKKALKELEEKVASTGV